MDNRLITEFLYILSGLKNSDHVLLFIKFLVKNNAPQELLATAANRYGQLIKPSVQSSATNEEKIPGESEKFPKYFHHGNGYYSHGSPQADITHRNKNGSLIALSPEEKKRINNASMSATTQNKSSLKTTKRVSTDTSSSNVDSPLDIKLSQIKRTFVNKEYESFREDVVTKLHDVLSNTKEIPSVKLENVLKVVTSSFGRNGPLPTFDSDKNPNSYLYENTSLSKLRILESTQSTAYYVPNYDDIALIDPLNIDSILDTPVDKWTLKQLDNFKVLVHEVIHSTSPRLDPKVPSNETPIKGDENFLIFEEAITEFLARDITDGILEKGNSSYTTDGVSRSYENLILSLDYLIDESEKHDIVGYLASQNKENFINTFSELIQNSVESKLRRIIPTDLYVEMVYDMNDVMFDNLPEKEKEKFKITDEPLTANVTFLINSLNTLEFLENLSDMSVEKARTELISLLEDSKLLSDDFFDRFSEELTNAEIIDSVVENILIKLLKKI